MIMIMKEELKPTIKYEPSILFMDVGFRFSYVLCTYDNCRHIINIIDIKKQNYFSVVSCFLQINELSSIPTPSPALLANNYNSRYYMN